MKSLIKYFHRKKTKKYFPFCFLVIAILALSPTMLFSENSGVGYHGAVFLRISPSARQVAMGEAFSALTNDLNLMRYNIGGLGGMQNTSFAANFHTWIDDTQQGSLAFGMPLKKYGVIGIDLSYFNEGNINKVDADFIQTGGSVYSGDLLLALGYGKFFDISGYKLGLGGAFKYLNQNLVGETSTVLGFDVGLQFFLKKYLSFGAAVQNFGLSKVKFDLWKSPLPSTYRAGTALTLPISATSNLIVAGDAAWTIKEKMRYFIGGELLINELLAIRGGYKINDVSVSKWALGFGLYVPTEWLSRSRMRFDYAYAPLNDFDAIAHRFSLHFSFGVFTTRAETIDQSELDEMRAKLAKELEEAERARLAAQEAEARTRELEEEMKSRLARIQQIAAESQGKIEVEPQTDKRILVTMRINFDFDKANIRREEFETMHQVGEILNTYPESQVHLSGHTDWIGTEEYNILLSHRRIDSVMIFLSKKERVALSRFYMPVGYGELRPIDTNETDEGRFRNRRVEFLLFTYDAKPEMPDGSAVKAITAVDSKNISIECNGKVEPKVMTFTNPDRLVIDLKDIYLLSDIRTITLNKGPFIRARLGFHPEERFTRVVLDLKNPVKIQTEVVDNFVKIKVVE